MSERNIWKDFDFKSTESESLKKKTMKQEFENEYFQILTSKSS